MGDRKRGDAVNFAPGPAQLPIEVLCMYIIFKCVQMDLTPSLGPFQFLTKVTSGVTSCRSVAISDLQVGSG